MRATRVEISQSALSHNLNLIRQLAQGRQLVVIVKANAYGHGLLNVAQAVQQQDWIGVACLDEAVALRKGGINNAIVLLEGCFDAAELTTATMLDCQVVVHHQHQIEQLQNLATDKQIKVWLKIDTGMHRLGFAPEQIPIAMAQLQAIKAVEQPINWMSHLAVADDVENRQSSQQIKLFSQLVEGLQGQKTMANSAGVMAWPESHFDVVRPGLLTYGCSPLLGKTGPEHQLQPVMHFRTEVIAINHIKAGDAVGYGATWRAEKNTTIAVIAVGYGDGYPRHAENGTPVLIKGKSYPLAGRVSMDMITVDLGNQHDVQVGDSVTLWGPGLPVEQVAEASGTVAYELLCSVTNRVRSLLVEQHKP